LPFVCIKNTKK